MLVCRWCQWSGLYNRIKKWWDVLSTIGPDFGYFPNDKKCWIIAKPAKEENVREVFKETSINVTVQGQKHLGAAIGSREYLEEYVSEKVSNWVHEVATLAEFALSQPQACYAAYTFGLKHRWTYFWRTLPDIQNLLEPLENAISQVLIPAITWEWEKAPVLKESSRHWAWNIYTSGLHYNRRNGQGMLEIP